MGFPTSDSNYSENNAYIPEISAGRVAEAAWDLGVGDRETSVLSKMKARDDLSQIGDKLQPNEINAQYPGLNADREMTLQEAQFVSDEKQERLESEKILQAASGSFLKGTVLPFVAGAGSAMADPIGFGVGAFTGWGLGKVITKAATQAGKKLALKGASKFALDTFDNAIGNSISEALIWKDKEQTFEEYTSADFLKNAIGGAVIMTGAIHGGAKGLRTVGKMGDKALDSFQRMTDTLAHEGKSPAAMEDVLNIMDSVLDHTPESKGIVEASFGDRVDLGDDMADSMANIKKAHEEGKISTEELESFTEKIEDSEVDNRVLELSQDKEFRLTDEELVKIDEKIKDPRSDLAHDHIAAKTGENMNDYNPETRMDELSQEVDDIFTSKEVDAEGAPVELELEPELKAIKQEMDNDTKLAEAQNDYLKCRLG